MSSLWKYSRSGSEHHDRGEYVPAFCRGIRVEDLQRSLPTQTTPQSTIHKTIKEHTINWLPTFHSNNNNNPNRKLLNKGLSHMIKSILSTASEMIHDQDKGRHKRQCTCAAKNHVMSKAVRQRDKASFCKTVLQPCKKKAWKGMELWRCGQW